MNSKPTSRLTSVFFCISFVFLLFQCTSSQPLSTSLLKSNSNNNDIGIVPDLIHVQPYLYSGPYESNFDNMDSEELSQLLSKALEDYNEDDEINRPSSSKPFRRANFWKRANFWRKRANFW